MFFMSGTEGDDEVKDPVSESMPEVSDTRIVRTVDQKLENPKKSRIDRVLNYISDKFSEFSEEEKADREKVKATKKRIEGKIDDMVKSDRIRLKPDTNIYEIFIAALTRTNASSDIWKLLEQYANKDLAQWEENPYGLSRFGAVSLAWIKDLFKEVQNPLLLKTFLEILLVSDEQEMSFLAHWLEYHENDIEKIWALHNVITQIRTHNSDNYQYIRVYREIVNNYDELIWYLEYLLQSNMFDSEAAREFIDDNLHFSPPYR